MMLRRRTLGRLAGAACLALSAAFAYQSLAAARITTTTEATAGGRQAPVLRGKVPLAFGAYELSVSFTPDGRIRQFHLDSAGAKRCGEV
jgi:hypothetical protein